jgi:hypothetical protein
MKFFTKLSSLITGTDALFNWQPKTESCEEATAKIESVETADGEPAEVGAAAKIEEADMEAADHELVGVDLKYRVISLTS